MIYTPLTKKALKISFDAHKNQVDKSGMPYVYHPFHLAEQMNDELSTCVALLHDVVEDTDITLDDIKSKGFSDEVIEALSLMTHNDGVPYLDYVRAMKDNPIARKVKLADLAHNSDLARLDKVDDKAIERVNKYKQAMDAVIDKFGKDVDVSAYDENSFKVDVMTSVGNVFYSWIFGFGGRVYINSPEDVKAEYAKMVVVAADTLEK